MEQRIARRHIWRDRTWVLLGAGIIAIFVTRTALATIGQPPRLNDLFTGITLVGSLAVWITGYRCLHRSDWVIAVSLGTVIGVTMCFATLYTPYYLLGIVHGSLGQGIARGVCTTVALCCWLSLFYRALPRAA